MIVGFDNGCQINTKLSLEQRIEANGLQFSLTVEVLPSNNLKIGSIVKAASINWPDAGSYYVQWQKMASNK